MLSLSSCSLRCYSSHLNMSVFLWKPVKNLFSFSPHFLTVEPKLFSQYMQYSMHKNLILSPTKCIPRSLPNPCKKWVHISDKTQTEIQYSSDSQIVIQIQNHSLWKTLTTLTNSYIVLTLSPSKTEADIEKNLTKFVQTFIDLFQYTQIFFHEFLMK